MKNTNRTLGRFECVLAVLALATLSACGSGAGDSPAPQARTAAMTVAIEPSASVTGLTKISETRIGRTEYEYVYRVNLKNGPVAQGGWTATLTGAGAGVTIVDGAVTFGSVAADATITSTDTITLRQDRNVAFNPAALVWNLQPEGAAQTLARLETSGAIPRLDRSSGLPGPDTNANGIRDDIDAYINTLNLSPEQKQAAQQMAKAYQAAVTINSADKNATTAIDNQMRDAIMCTYKHLPRVAGPGVVTAHQIVSDLQKLTANTEARVLAYLKFNGSRNGTVTSLPEGDGCAN